MQTIKSLIAERQGSLKAERAIMQEDRINSVYSRFPRLKEIDREVLEIRKSKIFAVLEDDSEPAALLEKRESELYEERNAFLKDNKIDPDFDKEIPCCDVCEDTGFTSTAGGIKIVCTKCMSYELNKCYDYCGMSDYENYTLKAYKHDYFGDKQHRKSVFEAVKKIFEGKTEDSSKLYVYSDKIQSGKTYLSVILVKYAIIEGIGAAYVKAEEVSSFDEDAMDFIKSCEFLLIDEYAAEITRDWRKASAINSVLEARIAGNLPTVVVSISSKEVLVADSDVRISGKLSRANVL